MLLTRTFIAYLARELTRRLGRLSLEIRDEQPLREHFDSILVDELSLEDAINAEVRELLNQYTDYMRNQRIPYQEMFKRVKRQVLSERKVITAQARGGDRTMKLSRDKVIEFSHKLGAVLPRVPGIRMTAPWNDIRLDIVREMTDILVKEEQIDKAAQEKVSSQKRDIPEGSEEWTLLYRRYYDEELQRYGIDLAPS